MFKKDKEDERFPKATLLELSWFPSHKYYGLPWKPRYMRSFNNSSLVIPFLFVRVTWRMPWHPHAAWLLGYHEAWRQAHEMSDDPTKEDIKC